MSEPSEPVTEPDGYTAVFTAVVEAQVTHATPCVPECPVCNPTDPEGD